MSKWSSLKDKYPKLPVEAGWAEKIDTILNSVAADWAPSWLLVLKASIKKPRSVVSPQEEKKKLLLKDLSDFQLAAMLDNVRDLHDSLEALKKMANWDIEALEKILIDRYEDNDETAKTFDGGLTLTLSDDPLPQVKDKEKLYAWLESNGGSKEDVLMFSAGKMGSLVKGCLAEGKALPDGVDVFMRTGLRRTFKK